MLWLNVSSVEVCFFFQEIVSLAPLHIVKLEFRIDEQKFNQYLKELEKELNIETQAFNRNENIPAILSRNKVA